MIRFAGLARFRALLGKNPASASPKETKRLFVGFVERCRQRKNRGGKRASGMKETALSIVSYAMRRLSGCCFSCRCSSVAGKMPHPDREETARDMFALPIRTIGKSLRPEYFHEMHRER